MTSAITETGTGTAGQRVLLVEDDPLIAMELEAALFAAGAGEVEICSTMDAAFSSLERGPAHAIILDVHLADRDDGWALAELASLLGSPPPRIAFSTATPEAIPPEIRALGEVFEKPYDAAQLAALLLNPREGGLMGRLRDALR
jgi:DNA-binding response OmpR family regulator